MTIIIHKIESFALALLLMPLLLCCCSSGGDEPISNDVDLSLVLNVSVLEPGATGSRANNTYFEQAELDTEKMQSLRVIIVNRKYNVIAYNFFKDDFEEPVVKCSGLEFKAEFSTAYGIYLIGNEAGLPERVQTTLIGLQEGEKYTAGTLEEIILPASAVADPIIDNTGGGNVAIPMTEKFEVAAIEKPASTAGSVEHIVEKNLFLTRAYSKFSFNFSVSQDYEGDNIVDIKAVKISGLGDVEYLYPNGTTYDPAKDDAYTQPDGGRIITAFNLPESATTGEYTFQLPENVTLFPKENTGETGSYSPELYFPESKGNGGFQCSISFDGETWLDPVTLPNLPALPRNTHVKVNITVGNNNSLRLTVNVLPWVPEYYEFDFTHNIAMAQDGALTFDEDTYASYDETAQRVVLNDYPNAVVGEFGISEPKGARWYAYLVTQTGELNVIQFVTTNSEGKNVNTPSISGIIDGQKTQLKVAATQSAGNQMRSALLQVMVVTDDGLAIPVNILNNTNPGDNIENVTFIQNPNN